MRRDESLRHSRCERELRATCRLDAFRHLTPRATRRAERRNWFEQI